MTPDSQSEQADLQRFYATAEEPLLAELRSIGIDVTSVWFLREATPSAYPACIPILLRYLDAALPPAVMDGVARSLAVPEASPWWDDLVKRLRAEPTPIQVRDGLAVAVARNINRARMQEAMELLDDDSLGQCRIFFVRPFKRIRDPRILPFLEARRDDPQIGVEINRALAGRSPNS